MEEHDRLFETIRDLVMRHSPSGYEGEIDGLLIERFEAVGLAARVDAAGNVVTKIPGNGGGRLAITAHKDEIGMIVRAMPGDGVLKVQNIGGSYPWIYGEGVVDLLGEFATVSGVLSFGSRHISHASPQQVFKDIAPVRWDDVWVETKLSAEELEKAGVRLGTRAVIGRHRKAPFRLKDHIASYTLDNKAALAIMLELAGRLKGPRPDVYLVASSKEEVSAGGAKYFAQRQELDAMIALEIAPIAPEYSIVDGTTPVLLAQDGHGLYDDGLNAIIRRAASARDVPLQMAVVRGFGSDGSISMAAGNVPRAACLGFPTQNTHGYEITHLGAVANCIDVLEAVCAERFG